MLLRVWMGAARRRGKMDGFLIVLVDMGFLVLVMGFFGAGSEERLHLDIMLVRVKG